MFKKPKEVRVDLVSDCLTYIHWKSRFLKSNHYKPNNCGICGKNK